MPFLIQPTPFSTRFLLGHRENRQAATAENIKTPSNGWTRFTHPCGNIYFEFKDSQKSKIILTDANIYDHSIYQTITKHADGLYEQLWQNPDCQGLRWELVLGHRQTESGVEIGYYFVDLEKERLAWLDGPPTQTLQKLLVQQNIIENGATLTDEFMCFEYWNHCSLFPHSRRLVFQGTLDKVQDMLLSISAGSILSGKPSLLPFSESEASSLLNIVSRIVIGAEGKKFDRTMSWVIATLMKISLDYEISPKIFQEPQPHTARARAQDSHQVYRFLQDICFLGIPSTHEKALEEIRISGVISTSGWANFVENLSQEASDLLLIATVLLNANVAFLAIPTIDQASNPLEHNKAQLFSYLSITTSLASIASGFGTQRVARRTLRPHAVSQNWPWNFAVFSALPLVCLVWAFAFFCVAVVFMIFTGLPNYLVTAIWLAALGFFNALFRKLSHFALP